MTGRDSGTEELRLEYENSVRALAERAVALRAEGKSSETIARDLHGKRRRLAAAFKDLTPEPLRTKVHARTIATYGNPVGPTIESLRSAGKSWEDIISAASRPGRAPG
jgi:hypothetical protein